MRIAVIVGSTWPAQPNARRRLFAGLNSLVSNLDAWEMVCGDASIAEKWVAEWAQRYIGKHPGQYRFEQLTAKINAYGKAHPVKGNRKQATAERDGKLLDGAQALFAVWDECEWRPANILREARANDIEIRILRYERIDVPGNQHRRAKFVRRQQEWDQGSGSDEAQ